MNRPIQIDHVEIARRRLASIGEYRGSPQTAGIDPTRRIGGQIIESDDAFRLITVEDCLRGFNTEKSLEGDVPAADDQSVIHVPCHPSDSAAMFDDLPRGMTRNVNRDEAPYDRKPGQRPRLSEREILDLVVFLRTLDDGFQP